MFWTDFRFAFRTLLRSPAFTLIAILILAVGIGGIATAFSIVDAFILQDLPYRDADRLVHLYRTDPQTGSSQLRFSLPMVDRLADDDSLADLGAYTYSGRNLSGGGPDPEHITAAILTNNLLELLGTTPALGRGFLPEDGQPGAPRVVLLDWGLFQRRYAASAEAIGTALFLDGEAHEIVGILPPEFSFPYGEVKAWTPVARSSNAYDWEWDNFQPVGRLAPGTAPTQVREALELAYRRIEADRLGHTPDFGLRLVPLREALLFLYDQIRLILLLVLCANGFVLLIICSNLANLMIGRAVGRTRETAIRGALGASRSQLARHLLTEGVILAAAGGAIGLLFAAWQVRLADSALPEALFRATPLSVDGRVIAATLGVSVVTTLLFALLPALQTSRLQLALSLKEGASGAGTGRGVGKARGGLVVVQVASAVVLLLGTGLMVRTVAHMQQEDLGFATEGILTMGVHLPQADYPNETRLGDFQEQARARLVETTGITEAAFVSPLPLNFASHGLSFEIEGRAPLSAGERLQAGAHWVGPGYFETMRQPLLRGRTFTPSDRLEAPPVTIINRNFAERWWPESEAVGQRVRLGTDDAWSTVVGVVADSKSFFANEKARSLIFVPMSQRPVRSPFLVVRTRGAPQATFPAVRQVLSELDANLPLSEVRSMSQVLEGSMLPWRGTASGLVLLAGLALILSLLGIYGVVTFSASSRTTEIGIRRAMGASSVDVLQLILRHSAVLVTLGLGVGLGLGVALNQLLSSLLFGVEAHDPLTYAAVSFVLLLAAGLAALVPALRALRVDPIRALRYE